MPKGRLQAGRVLPSCMCILDLHQIPVTFFIGTWFGRPLLLLSRAGLAAVMSADSIKSGGWAL